MVTLFENLSNELLLDIFDYINPLYLYDIFWNVNSRLNNLLNSIKHLHLIINNKKNEDIISLLAPHIGLLQVNTWDEIDLNGFCNLYSLTLIRPSIIQLKQIRADIMPKLVHLSLFSNVYFIAPKQLIYDTFSNKFSCLRSARLGHIDSIDSIYKFQSLSLRYLHIGCYNTIMIPFILSSCPNLLYLHVDLVRDGNKIELLLPTINKHPLRQFILRDYCRLVSYKDIYNLITYISNVQKLELRFHCNNPFISLIQYLSDQLSHLRIFNCNITEFPIDVTTNLITIQQVHPCFYHIRCCTQGSDFRVFDTQ